MWNLTTNLMRKRRGILRLRASKRNILRDVHLEFVAPAGSQIQAIVKVHANRECILPPYGSLRISHFQCVSFIVISTSAALFCNSAPGTAATAASTAATAAKPPPISNALSFAR